MALSTYTALTVSSKTTSVTHLWVGAGNLCGAEFTLAPSVRQLAQNTICKKCLKLQDEYEAAQQAGEEERARIAATAPARRLTHGDTVITGWELLYDKPAKRAQIGRRDKKYVLICTDHRNAHPLEKLVDDRALLKGERSAWCPECH